MTAVGGPHLNMSAEAFRDLWKNAEGGREYSLLVTGYSMRPSLLHAGLSYIFRK